ncbi:MAG: hypothetical protein ACR2PH_10710 [Desulfobulbia bacterium]
MSYSRQSCDGVTVENKDGEIYVNGRHIENGEKSVSKKVFDVLFRSMIFMAGYYVCFFNHLD